MANILVSGGAGFIGSHLVDRLIAEDHMVSVLDNLSNGRKENVSPKARLIIGDVNQDLFSCLNGESFDFVYHLAAKIDLRDSSPEAMHTNTNGTFNLVEYSLKHDVKKFIFSSSAAVYSPDVFLPTRESDLINPMSEYGKSKKTGEFYLEMVCEEGKIDYAALRYSNVYGPRQGAKGEGGVISIFCRKALNGEVLDVFGDGEQTRDFIYVEDIVQANLRALDLSGVYNVSNNKEISVNDLGIKIMELTGSNKGRAYHPGKANEVQRSCLSNDKLKNMGWEPKIGLDEGLRKTIDWFRQHRS